jgi:membrane-bound lytic murein transglycosylase D
MHGDWHLALASYNWGEGSVKKAIARNRAAGKPTDYLNLKMPDETRHYVPKLQAVKNIVAQPELFGLNIDPIPNQPYFSAVERSGNMDIAIAAKLADIPLDEFIALNPAYSRPVIPGAAKAPLALPTNKVQTYLENLQNHEALDRPLSNWLTYTLKKGERFDSVANRHGISSSRLKQLNGINSRTKLGAGFTLLIPGKDATGYEVLAAKLPQTPSIAPKSARGKKGKGAASTIKASKTVSTKSKKVVSKRSTKQKAKSALPTTPVKKKHHNG